MDISKSDYKLLLIFLLLCFQVLGVSSVGGYMWGGLSSDSAHYLRLTDNLLGGKGLFLEDLYVEGGQSYFATWPAGYPLAIALVSKILSLDVFFASKVVNILFIGLTLFVFRRIFGAQAYIFGALFFLWFMVRINHMTWSENAFIPCMVFLAVLLARFDLKKDNASLLAIGVVCISAFLFRYLGVTTLIAVGVLGLYHLYGKHYKAFLKLAVVGVVCLAFMLTYFAANVGFSGYMTGMERKENLESIGVLLFVLIATELRQYALLVVAAVVFYGVRRWREEALNLGPWVIKAKNFSKQVASPLGGRQEFWPYFLLVGCSYWLFVVGLRFFLGGTDTFGFRMMAPSSFLFVIGLFDYLRCRSHYFELYKNCLLFLLVGSVLSFSYSVVQKWSVVGWASDEYQKREMAYAEILPDSVVIYGDRYMSYIRQDVHVAAKHPHYSYKLDHNPDELLLDYAARKCESGLINAMYFNVDRWPLEEFLERMDKGWVSGPSDMLSFIKEHQGKGLVKLVECEAYKG